jgi:DNA-binding CsgD family transcriptional regulator
LIAAGRPSKQIAADLGISFKTAVTHRTHIMEKLDLHTVAGLVRYAVSQ